MKNTMGRLDRARLDAITRILDNVASVDPDASIPITFFDEPRDHGAPPMNPTPTRDDGLNTAAVQHKLTNREKLLAKMAPVPTSVGMARPTPARKGAATIAKVALPDPDLIPTHRATFHCDITPEWAVSVVEKDALNRGITQRRVDAYAADMAADAWLDIGDPVRFDSNGDLRDGQHRLWACIQAKKPFAAWIHTGLDPASFHKIDSGKPRSPADDLVTGGHLAEAKYATSTAAALRLLVRWERETMDEAKNRDYLITRAEIIEAIRRHPQIALSSRWASCIKLYSGGVCVFLHYLLAQQNREAADAFFMRLKDGMGLQEGSPILALRNRLIKNKGDKKAGLTFAYLIAITVKAWNVWRQGNTIHPKHLNWNPETGMPRPM